MRDDIWKKKWKYWSGDYKNTYKKHARLRNHLTQHHYSAPQSQYNIWNFLFIHHIAHLNRRYTKLKSKIKAPYIQNISRTTQMMIIKWNIVLLCSSFYVCKHANQFWHKYIFIKTCQSAPNEGTLVFQNQLASSLSLHTNNIKMLVL